MCLGVPLPLIICILSLFFFSDRQRHWGPYGVLGVQTCVLPIKQNGGGGGGDTRGRESHGKMATQTPLGKVSGEKCTARQSITETGGMEQRISR